MITHTYLLPFTDTEIPIQLLLPGISKKDFIIDNVNKIDNLDLSNNAKSFFRQMLLMIQNENVDSGISKTKTDTVVIAILTKLEIEWPLTL